MDEIHVGIKESSIKIDKLRDLAVLVTRSLLLECWKHVYKNNLKEKILKNYLSNIFYHVQFITKDVTEDMHIWHLNSVTKSKYSQNHACLIKYNLK